MAKLMNRTESDMIGKTDVDLFGTQEGEDAEQMMLKERNFTAQHMLEGNIGMSKWRVRGFGQDFDWYEATVPLEKAGKKIVGILGAYSDLPPVVWISTGKDVTVSNFASVAMRSCLEKALQVARSDSRVLPWRNRKRKRLLGQLHAHSFEPIKWSLLLHQLCCNTRGAC